MKLGAGGKLGCNSQQGFLEEAERHTAEGISPLLLLLFPAGPQNKLNKASDVSILRATREAGNYKMKRRGGQKLSSKISNTFPSLPSRERAPFQQARVCTA